MGTITEQNNSYIIIGNYCIAWGTIEVLEYYSSVIYNKVIEFPLSFVNTNYNIQLTPNFSMNSKYRGQINMSPAGIAKDHFTARAISNGIFVQDESIGCTWLVVGRIK